MIEEHASALDKKAKVTKSDSSFVNAWKLLQDSFADNQEQVLDAVYQAAVSNIRYRDVLNLNGTVWLFKELGRQDLANDVIRRYLEVRGDNRRPFDLQIHPFRDKIDDPDVIQAFQERCAALKDERDPVEVLLSMAKMNGWNDEDISALSSLGADRYYEIFKEQEGPELRNIIKTCLQFGAIGNATETMKEISRRAEEALARIGRESPINALRVRKYGIEVSKGGPTQTPPPPPPP